MRVLVDSLLAERQPDVPEYFRFRRAKCDVMPLLDIGWSKAAPMYNIVFFDYADETTIKIVEAIRADRSQTVILVASSGIPADRRLAVLEAGADDLLDAGNAPEGLTKAWNLAERQDAQSRHSVITVGNASGLTLNERSRSISLNGDIILLSPVEFMIVRHFINHPGQLIPIVEIREMLVRGGLASTTNSIRVTLSNLRVKLAKVTDKLQIRSRYRAGYCLLGGSFPEPEPTAPMDHKISSCNEAVLHRAA